MKNTKTVQIVQCMIKYILFIALFGVSKSEAELVSLTFRNDSLDLVYTDKSVVKTVFFQVKHKRKGSLEILSVNKNIQILPFLPFLYSKVDFNRTRIGFTTNGELDEKGRRLAEIWLKNNTLEHKEEYTYSEDGRERIKQDYHMPGTQKSTKTTGRYDANNNLIFKQCIEYSGNPLDIETYEYKYDSEKNWTERKSYRQSVDNGIIGDRILVNIEIREITYYSETNKPRQFQLPQFPEKAQEIRTVIPQLAKIKQERINASYEAVESGNFEREIVLKEAAAIDDFTPAFWKRVKVDYGNLDSDPDEEAVAVYETSILADLGYKHSLAVYKKIDNGWRLWHQTTSPVLSTQAGGMMGNPFYGIAIERKCIVINHFGGSRQKWNYTHRYRFQNNNWYVIGATINFGAPCDYFKTLDYNHGRYPCGPYH